VGPDATGGDDAAGDDDAAGTDARGDDDAGDDALGVPPLVTGPATGGGATGSGDGTATAEPTDAPVAGSAAAGEPGGLPPGPGSGCWQPAASAAPAAIAPVILTLSPSEECMARRYAEAAPAAAVRRAEPDAVYHAGMVSPIALVVRARPRDLGAFTVRRSLPAVQRRLVGPFIFFDHMGPAELEAGRPLEVRPHPHIGLATVTYLFEGEIFHRDSLGFAQVIRPGDVNWMVAGRGIVHSERGTDAQRERGGRLHGIQLWVALPTALEETEPSFVHHPGATIPAATRKGVALRIVLGSAYGVESPVRVLSPTFYVEARLEGGAVLPMPDEHHERAAYVVEGEISVGGEPIEAGAMAIFEPGVPVELRATQPARVMLLGGATLDGERHIEWNFVSSSKERIATAKAEWAAERFPLVPGDEKDRIPLPE